MIIYLFMKEKEQRELMKIAWPRMAIIKKRKQKLQELADIFSTVLWNQIMTSGEREIWQTAPEDFYVLDRFTLTDEHLNNTFSYPGLIKPVEEAGRRSNCWMLYDGEFYNPSSIRNVDINLNKWKAKQFFISIPEYVSMSSSGIWTKRELEKEICWPGLNNISLRLGKEFLTSNTIKNHRDNSYDLILEETEEVKELKTRLIEFVNIYRQEYFQRTNLWKFLSTEGVSPAKCEKFWPELFDKNYEQSDS